MLHFLALGASKKMACTGPYSYWNKTFIKLVGHTNPRWLTVTNGSYTQVYMYGGHLTTLRFPLVSRSASRNSPARLGSILSCSRRASLPTPGRHSGRIPEWHTETRTDIKTVLQQAVRPGPLHAVCWDEAETGAGGAQPPELSAMSRALRGGVGVSEAPRQVLLLPAASI